MDDPFGTGDLRERVLRAWAAAPARFREDANAEEDYALGGYRDRVVIELAQNAADAALRAGVPGRLRLSLRGGVLTAANTGTPLDATGVEALSTLRASAKRDEIGTAGRFGVGFAAVVAVSDEPSMISAEPGGAYPYLSGQVAGVQWSAARTRELVEGIPALADELSRRAGRVPVLRLPFPADPARLEEFATAGHGAAHEAEAKPGDERRGDERYDTVVRLPLRDAEAERSVRRALDQLGPALMLGLPALAEVEIEVDGTTRTLTATHGDGMATINGTEWRTVEAHGEIPPQLLADRPAEERTRPYWRLRWAALADGAALPADVPAVIHAPTPSDERLGLPALLIASFPLAPDRRHAAPGPLTDFLVERAARGYVDLLRAMPVTPRLLDLVPGRVGSGELDARLRGEILAELPGTPLMPVASGPEPADADLQPSPGPAPRSALQRGRDAVAVDGSPALLGLLAPVLPGLLPAGWPVRHPALAALGVRRIELADVIDALAGLEREASWWHRLYDALSGADADALGALPVPLAEPPGDDEAETSEGAGFSPRPRSPAGRVRMRRGPRGLLIAGPGVDPAELAALDLRFVHPEAAHPLLHRLGAVEAGPRAILADPAVRAAVAGSYDSDDPEPVARAVLGLVAAARPSPGEEPWLADLTLPGADGEFYAAGELLLPGGPLHDVVAADAPFGVADPALVERYGAEALEAVGVLGTFALVREHDVPLTDLAFDLDGEEAWAREVLARLPEQDVPPLLPELVAVRDLELVQKWDAALRMLAEPPLRSAVADPAYVVLDDGRRVAVPSYTAWWLRRHPVLGGRRPADLAAPGSDPLLAGLYDLAPAGSDPGLLRVLGVRTSLAELLAEPGGADELLNLLADPERTVSRAQLRALWTELSHLDPADVDPPARVRAVTGHEPEVVPAEDALILDSPDLLPLLGGQPLILAGYDGAGRLAELLDISQASEEIPGTVESRGTVRPVPDVVREILPGAPDRYVEHHPLVVDGLDVQWRYDGVTLHASGPAGLARGLAWAAGRWADRLLVEAVLRDPRDLPVLLAEADLDEHQPPS
ncbi:sacsin N-terminal ATP-binding-like domain-containing protein [Actinomadura alba]|uniref:Molecular chaperone Hsp90 n=1 Tax=Actinomadura alba TaxID=406431 RepID=A0ABR7LLK0_9ACTN|nr:hypothetical protein [Actinomadura alba]MBC6465641.1 hypothetical protein [Actinomadura alba]